MKIRPYQHQDEAAVIALWQACDLTRPWNDPAKDIARKWTDSPELFLIGVQDGAIIASAMFGYDGHRGWVNYLAVAPNHRRQGRAQALLRAGEALLSQRGCPKINLQIRADNPAAQGFWAAAGYQQDPVISYGKRLIKDD